MPSSISISAITEVTGLDMEAMRNRVSRRMGVPFSMSWKPRASLCNTFTSCQVRVTTPERSPRSMKGISPSVTAEKSPAITAALRVRA